MSRGPRARRVRRRHARRRADDLWKILGWVCNPAEAIFAPGH
jgi:hypothetical protein